MDDTIISNDPPGRELYAGYAAAPGVYDEMVTSEGALRPHWRDFVAGLATMDDRQRARGKAAAERMIHENGITYDIHADGAARPWDLDLVPLLIPADDWRRLEAGLIQRANLLNAILADLYGPQRLLKENHLPAPLVFASPSFLRPAHGIAAPNGVYLHAYAADLGRAPDGRWWVLNDHTDAPSGSGYSLENRIVLSRCLPDLFWSCQVHTLGEYFQALHDHLVAASGRDEPRIVLLSPGPQDKSYFANAYFARYLGYTHVEGADLTMRDKHVYLKTLDGLQQVDVIVRRIPAGDCDPLELSPFSSTGVAGLVQAVRAGNVVIANALGSGIVECEGFKGFLPSLCRSLLGEDLLLPSNATWWCGQPDARDYVIENLDKLVIGPAFGQVTQASGAATIGAGLTVEQKNLLAEQVHTRGYHFVGQELVKLSTGPVWLGGRLQPGPMTLRVMVVASGDSYVVMPGGLTRVSRAMDSRSLALHEGVGSKDTWVLSERPERIVNPISTPLGTVSLRRTGKDLPSRAADNLFWLGRYAERTEGTMRALRSVLTRFAEDSRTAPDLGAVHRLLGILLKRGRVPPASRAEKEKGPETVLERQLSTLMFDPGCAYGLRESMNHLHRTATLARDRLSVDAWRTLQRLRNESGWRRRRAGLFSGRLEIGDVLDLLSDAIRTMAAFSGMEMENMTRNHAWRFVNMGRRLERALDTTLLLRRLLARGDPEENASLSLLLELADSFMTYRSRYMATPALAPVIDLLLLDEINPRSVGFQIAALAGHIDLLPRDHDVPVRGEDQRIVLALLTELRLADIATLCRTNKDQKRPALNQLLGRVHRELPHLSEVIASTYFAHAEQRRAPDVLRHQPVT